MRNLPVVLAATLLLICASPAVADTDVVPGDGSFDSISEQEESGDSVDEFVPYEKPAKVVDAQGASSASNVPYTSPTAGCTFLPYTGTDAVDPQARNESTVDPACFETAPAPADPAAPNAPARPQITEAMVQRAFERVPVPAFASQTQPVGKTLVNFDTIFYVEAEPMTEQVTLLGQQVTLFITPATYTWDHGDGTSETTTTPGAAYPSKEVVHRYADARTTVEHHVTIEWTATYSVDGGAQQPVDGTVVTTGPATDLRISEAAPALSGDR